MALASSPPDYKSVPGMAMGAIAFALMTALDVVFKLMAEGHPAHQIIFVNGCFALIPIFGWALLTGGLHRLHTTHPVHHAFRGVIAVAAAFSAIYAYSRLPLANFYAIVFTGPLIVTLLSAIFLKEAIDRERWIAIGGGFFGVLIVTHFFGDLPNAPPTIDVTAGRIAAFISVFCYALSVIIVRRMRLGESNVSFSLYGHLAAISIGGAILFVQGGPALSPDDIAHLALSGFLGGTATICLMTAYQRAPVALVAPFQYTQIIWGALAGYMLWGRVPDIYLIVGAVIVAACGLFVIYRETHAKEAL
ncbi:MAG: DMT family transporter [Alphaproteobacteria bacterium]|nr:DMT family transporter [Alphaproteobacteria bacterium]